MEEIINKIPKLYDDNYRFCIIFCNSYWQIGYTRGNNAWLATPKYQTISGETLLEGLIKFKELI